MRLRIKATLTDNLWIDSVARYRIEMFPEGNIYVMSIARSDLKKIIDVIIEKSHEYKENIQKRSKYRLEADGYSFHFLTDL